ncbi:TraI domain-containing protein [Chania multitudinisentens]|uniref:TraI domain-containing protein n=1 Tax=Chania multitudinisentens TaxID=1639108 RepID=UPI0003E126D5|nr:TraI domain-containing protein [Chania multitudinisentens]
MLKAFLKYLPVASGMRGHGNNHPVPPSPAIPVPDGYHAPLSVSEQLAVARRGQWLQMLWDYSSLPKNLYQQYYLQPLEHCVTLMQQFPATESGHHAYLGGMVDYLLETVAYAARLSKNYLLPMGAPPEEQATQSTAWNAVIVYAAMVQSLDGLSQIDVELVSGQRWTALKARPGEPYRFRFKPVTGDTQTQSLNAMLAWKVIPDEVLLWLSSWPEILNTLALYVTGFRDEAGIVNAIVSDAIRASTGKTVPVVASSTVPLPLAASERVPSADGIARIAEQPPLQSSIEQVVSVNQVLSLDSAVGDSAFSAGEVARTEQEDNAIRDLLAVMGLSEEQDPITTLHNISPQTPRTNEAVAFPGTDHVGEKFWQWLSEGCCRGIFPVNTPHARIHIIAGYVFVRAPAIFHQFLTENRESTEDKTSLQNAFERLGMHRQDNGMMYTCHLYQNEAKEGRFQKMAGYLIPVAKVYGAAPPPANSTLVIIRP